MKNLELKALLDQKKAMEAEATEITKQRKALNAREEKLLENYRELDTPMKVVFFSSMVGKKVYYEKYYNKVDEVVLEMLWRDVAVVRRPDGKEETCFIQDLYPIKESPAWKAINEQLPRDENTDPDIPF